MLSIPMDAEIEQHLEALGAKTAASKAKLARERLLEALKEAGEAGLTDLGDLYRVEEILAGREEGESGLASQAAES